MTEEQAWLELSSLPQPPFQVVRNLDSTQRHKLKHKGPEWLVAVTQSAGQGRQGRAWSSPPGGLWFSFLHLAQKLDGLSLEVALACARLAQARGLKPWLRWPNDVMVGDRKLAGVLVDARWSGELAQAVIGVGINVEVSEWSSEVSSIAINLGGGLAQTMLDFYQQWQSITSSTWQQLYPEISALLFAPHPQAQVEVSVDGKVWRDRVEGLAPDGALRLASGEELYRVEHLRVLTSDTSL